jgi:hypothetical protein
LLQFNRFFVQQQRLGFSIVGVGVNGLIFVAQLSMVLMCIRLNVFELLAGHGSAKPEGAGVRWAAAERLGEF